MTRPRQKRDERLALDHYLGLLGISEYAIEDGPEPPDLIATVGKDRIGVEVTDYHSPVLTSSGHTRRVVEAAWDALRASVVEYREENNVFDDLSIILNFPALEVPGKREHRQFIDAVAEVIRTQNRIANDFTDIAITRAHPAVLQRYLTKITVRRVRAYLEWDWNHMVAGVGTNQPELLANIRPKLGYIAPAGLTRNILIVAGGWRHSTIIAAWSVEQLEMYGSLTKALTAGPFDEVALLCMDNFVWRRGEGWRKLKGSRP